MGPISSDEHDAEHGVRSGPKQPPAQERIDKPEASASRISRERNSEVM